MKRIEFVLCLFLSAQLVLPKRKLLQQKLGCLYRDLDVSVNDTIFKIVLKKDMQRINT